MLTIKFIHLARAASSKAAVGDRSALFGEPRKTPRLR